MKLKKLLIQVLKENTSPIYEIPLSNLQFSKDIKVGDRVPASASSSLVIQDMGDLENWKKEMIRMHGDLIVRIDVNGDRLTKVQIAKVPENKKYNDFIDRVNNSISGEYNKKSGGYTGD